MVLSSTKQRSILPAYHSQQVKELLLVMLVIATFGHRLQVKLKLYSPASLFVQAKSAIQRWSYPIFPPLPSDTTFTGIKCNADTVYFEKEILPIITANCAYSGCHNTVTAADGIKLDNYANIIKYGKIKPFNVSKSELYEVITDTDQKKYVMPPPPAAKLSVAQIASFQSGSVRVLKIILVMINPADVVQIM